MSSSRSIEIGKEEILALHGRLAAAGAGELRGTLEDRGVLASRHRFTRITFFKSSAEPSLTWSNTFSFGSAPFDERAHAIWLVLEQFVWQHLGRTVIEE